MPDEHPVILVDAHVLGQLLGPQIQRKIGRTRLQSEVLHRIHECLGFDDYLGQVCELGVQFGEETVDGPQEFKLGDEPEVRTTTGSAVFLGIPMIGERVERWKMGNPHGMEFGFNLYDAVTKDPIFDKTSFRAAADRARVFEKAGIEASASRT